MSDKVEQVIGMTTEQAVTTPKPKRRWLQFSLRTMLIAVALAGVMMGLVLVPIEREIRQRAHAKAVADAGVSVTKEDDVDLLPPITRPPTAGCYASIAEVFVGTDEGMKYLKEFPNARTVGIHSQVTDAEMEHIRDVPRLESLTIGQSKVTNAGLRHVGDLTGLQKLYLCSNTISDDGLQYIGSLPKLERLDLNDVSVSDAGLVHLKGLSNLTTLMITRTSISGAGLENLSRLPNLELVAFWNAPVTDSGLVGLRVLTQLRDLWSHDAQTVTDAGLSHVKKLAQLESLVLVNVPITDAGLAHLEQMPCLHDLDIRGTGITAMGIRRFVRASPVCKTWVENTRIDAN